MLKRWNFLKTGFYEGIKDLRKAMVGILEDLSADQTQVWIHSHGGGATHFTAGLVLNRAGHLSSFQGALWGVQQHEGSTEHGASRSFWRR